jgi:hypothetical protein
MGTAKSKNPKVDLDHSIRLFFGTFAEGPICTPARTGWAYFLCYNAILCSMRGRIIELGEIGVNIKMDSSGILRGPFEAGREVAE